MKMNIYIFKTILSSILICVMFRVEVFAQPQLLWEIQIGDSTYDFARSMEICANGDYLFISDEEDYPNHDIHVDKVSSEGVMLWSEILTDVETGNHLELLETGLFLVHKGYYSDDFIFSVYDSELNIVFDSEPVEGYSDKTHKYYDSSYISCSNDSSSYLRRYDNMGNVLWTSHFTTDGIVSCYDVTYNINGAIYASINYIYPMITSFIKLKRFDNDGNELWSREWERLNEFDPHGTTDIEILPNGNIFMSGNFSMEPDTSFAGFLTSPDGDIIDYWGGPWREMYVHQDGTYTSITYAGSNLVFRRYNAIREQTYAWQYTINNIEFINRVFMKVTQTGDLVIFGDYYYWVSGDDYENNTFALSFRPPAIELEVAITRYGQRDFPAPSRFFWHGTLTNNTDADITTDVWVIVRGPDGYPSEPLRVWEDITVPANGVYEADLRQNIPADVASGEYNYIVRAGTYEPGDPQHTIQAYFPLTITGGAVVDLDPPRVRGVVAAPFDEPTMVELSPELKTTD